MSDGRRRKILIGSSGTKGNELWCAGFSNVHSIYTIFFCGSLSHNEPHQANDFSSTRLHIDNPEVVENSGCLVDATLKCRK